MIAGGWNYMLGSFSRQRVFHQGQLNINDTLYGSKSDKGYVISLDSSSKCFNMAIIQIIYY